MGRYDVTDEEYALIEPELPTNEGKVGRASPVINGILWRLHTEAPWPDIPERYEPWKTLHDRYTWWRRNGACERILKGLLAKLDAKGRIDWEQ